MKPIEEFIKLVENEKFEEAHEVLEEKWLLFKKEALMEKALFYKGLINGATAIALILRNRSQRAKTITWEAFLKYSHLYEIMPKENHSDYKYAISLLHEKHKYYSKN